MDDTNSLSHTTWRCKYHVVMFIRILNCLRQAWVHAYE